MPPKKKTSRRKGGEDNINQQEPNLKRTRSSIQKMHTAAMEMMKLMRKVNNN